MMESDEVLYKLYKLEKDGDKNRDILTIVNFDLSPTTIPATTGTVKITIDKLKADTVYEVVIRVINDTDAAKSVVSKFELRTLGSATALGKSTIAVNGTPTGSSIAITITVSKDTGKNDGSALKENEIGYMYTTYIQIII